MTLVRPLWLLVGVYAGIYLDQHYKLPKIDDPKQLWAKVREYAAQFEKESPGPSKKDD